MGFKTPMGKFRRMRGKYNLITKTEDDEAFIGSVSAIESPPVSLPGNLGKTSDGSAVLAAPSGVRLRVHTVSVSLPEGALAFLSNDVDAAFDGETSGSVSGLGKSGNGYQATLAGFDATNINSVGNVQEAINLGSGEPSRQRDALANSPTYRVIEPGDELIFYCDTDGWSITFVWSEEEM